MRYSWLDYGKPALKGVQHGHGFTWVWVRIKPPGHGPQVLVHVSTYQGSIWVPIFDPTATFECMHLAFDCRQVNILRTKAVLRGVAQRQIHRGRVGRCQEKRVRMIGFRSLATKHNHVYVACQTQLVRTYVGSPNRFLHCTLLGSGSFKWQTNSLGLFWPIHSRHGFSFERCFLRWVMAYGMVWV